MVNMQLLTRLKSVTVPARNIFTTTIRSKNVVCGANKSFNFLHDEQPYQENLETIQLRHPQAQSYWNILNFASPTFGQLGTSVKVHGNYMFISADSKGQIGKHYPSLDKETTTLSDKEVLANRVDSNVSMSPKPNKQASVWPSFPKNQRETFLNGLFGSARHDFLSYLKHRLRPASRNYGGLNYVPSRTYVDLPEMPYPRDKSGYTLTWDLGKEDKKRIQNIACDELQVLLKKHEIPFTLVKTWKKIKAEDGKIYKTSLEALVERDIRFKRMDDTHLQVPAVIKWMGLSIQEMGRSEREILKKNVDFTSIKEFINDLETNFYLEPESFKVEELCQTHRVGVVGTAWKLLFLELPVSLMTSPKIEFFPEIYALPLKEQVEILNLFILTLTPVHMDTLVYVVTILNHLSRIPETKMTAMDFGHVFGPLLFKKFSVNMTVVEKEPKQRELDSATRLMVYYSERMFIVPPNIMTKLRESYEEENKSKSKSIFPWSKKKEPTAKREVGRPKKLDIQVFDVESNKTETITIDGKTTVGDVLAIYHGRRPGQPHYLEELKERLRRKRIYVKLPDDGRVGAQAMDRTFGMLHEVGGNIGQRLLGFEVNMMDMMEINPNAKFEIRPNKQVFV